MLRFRRLSETVGAGRLFRDAASLSLNEGPHETGENPVSIRPQGAQRPV